MTAKNKINKFISAFLIISIILPAFLFYQPKKVNAQWAVFDVITEATSTISSIFNGTSSVAGAGNFALHIKDIAFQIMQQLLKVAAKRVLAAMTQATVNWINSGFHGSPLFIQNPSSFFNDIAKSEVKSLVDMIGYDTFRFPFGPQTALNVISSYKSQLATNAQYTLSKVINDPDLLRKYQNDFNYGGWNGFLINTQYPQNNYLGFQGLIQQNLASRLEGTLQAPAQKIQNTLQQSMGFLSPQTCPSNSAYNNGTNEFVKPSFQYNVPYPTPADVMNPQNDPAYNAKVKSWNDGKAAAQATWAKTNSCPGGLQSTTPGSVAANQVMQAVGSPFLTTALDGAIGNSLAAIFDALVNHFIGGGLTSLASAINPGSSTDNWSYNGQTLSSASYNSSTATAGGGIGGALTIPTDVSVTANPAGSTTYDTSKVISGGTAPYTIKTAPVARYATAKITRDTAGSTLTIHGVSKGNTSVVIQDSSKPTKTTSTINIAVYDVGDLIGIPANVAINVNDTANVTISGGLGPYTVQTDANQGIAVTTFTGTNLVITGVTKESTWVRIQDSSTTPKTVTIPIDINAPLDLTVAKDVSFDMGTQPIATTTISGGTAPYFVQSVLDTTIATADISSSDPTQLEITGVAGGQTAVIITDSSNPVKIATVNIEVTAPANSVPLGMCTIGGTKLKNMSEQACIGGGGIWAQTSTSGGSTTDPLGSCRSSVGTVSGDSGGTLNLNVQTTQSECINNIHGSWTQTVIPELVVPENILMTTGQTANITITGGKKTYSLQTTPNTGVATATISSPTLTVHGVALGQTSIIVKDSTPTPSRTTTSQIIVTAPATGSLVIPQNVSMGLGQLSSVVISGGKAPYQIVPGSYSGSVLSAQILGTTLKIIGLTQQTTTVKVRDSSSPVKVSSVSITITPPAQTGTCTEYDGSIDKNSTQNDCNANAGTWQ